ncbi:MAG: HAD family hydrolase [Spirochaetota bacterium]
MVKLKSMVNSEIKGVFFDYGGIIEDISYDEKFFRKGVGILTHMLNSSGLKVEEPQLLQWLPDGHRKYMEWVEANNYRELPNREIWTRFLVAPAAATSQQKKLVLEMGEELSRIYEYYLYRRRPSRMVTQVVKNLFNAGYVIALVSNTMSSTLIPERLRKLGIDACFSSVVLSVNVGIRKPAPGIFETAFKKTGLLAQRCIYVGDTLSRDVLGSKSAGLKKAVLKRSAVTDDKDSHLQEEVCPDATIQEMEELYSIL